MHSVPAVPPENIAIYCTAATLALENTGIYRTAATYYAIYRTGATRALDMAARARSIATVALQ